MPKEWGSMRTITWLHISDLHTNNPKHKWDYDKVTDRLVKRLKADCEKQGFSPDFIFFTGDIAYGNVGEQEGETLTSQYERAHGFLEAVRRAVREDFPKEDIFIVPGNHDIDVGKHHSGLESWLKGPLSLAEIHDKIKDADDIWPSFMEKLEAYTDFLRQYGYQHLVEGNGDGVRYPDRGIYTVLRERHGLKIAITGLNSAWSSSGKGESEAGQLRLGGETQIDFFYDLHRKANFTIALMHHPVNWFAADESDTLENVLANRFHFLLHGHKHANTVHSIGRYTRISAGACYERDKGETGYNFVRLNLDEATGEVWLRRYAPEMGGGWVEHVMPNNTTNVHGMRSLKESVTWMKDLPLAPLPEAPAEPASPPHTEAKPMMQTAGRRETTSSLPRTDFMDVAGLSEEPLELVAIPPAILAEYLCDLGSQLVIGNTYIPPEFERVGGEPNALSRIYVGPADCGKTRAALEWIQQKVDATPEAWTVLRAETGAIPRDKSKFVIDRDAYYRRPHRLPKKAILFLDDLPEYLGPNNRGNDASDAVRRLFEWFSTYPGFEERCLVGTIRSERMGDKPDWPEKLPELGHRLELLAVPSLSQTQRRALWEGMKRGSISQGGQIEAYDIEIDTDFIDALVDEAAPPEAIAYFVRSVAIKKEPSHLTRDDAPDFFRDVAMIWCKRTWPAISENYGMAARVFYTLARLLEAGTRRDSDFLTSLPPKWEYHAVLGSALLAYYGQNEEDYLPVLTQMLADGNAAGREGEWIRPQWDFLLQAPELESVELPFPPWAWFAECTTKLSPIARLYFAFHLASADISNPTQEGDAYWLLGWANGKQKRGDSIEEERSKEFKKAISSYNGFLERFEASKAPEIQELVARALLSKGGMLFDLKCPEEAIAVCDALLSHFWESEVSEIQEQVARALYNKGVVLGQLKRPEEAIGTYDSLLSRFGSSEESAIQEQVARALFNKGVVLGQLKRPEEAIATYDSLLSRFVSSEESEIQIRVARALFNKGVVLGQLKRPEEAIATYDSLLSRFVSSEESEIQEQVAKALYNKGFVLGELKRPEEAIATYDSLLSRFVSSEESAIQAAVAKALYNKGFVLGELKRPEEEIATYNSLLSRFVSSEESAIQEQVAKALNNKGFLLGELKRPEEAIGTYDSLLSRFVSSEESAIQAAVAKALYNKGFVLGQLKRPEEAIGTYDSLLSRFVSSEESAIQEQVARALFNKGVVLGELKRPEEEIATYDSLLSRFVSSEESEIQIRVAKALYNKGFVLGELKRPEEAVAVYDAMLSRFDSSEVPEIQKIVEDTLNNRSNALLKIWLDTGEDTYLKEMLASARRSVTLGGKHYNLSCALALSGEVEEAFDELAGCLEREEIAWSHVDGTEDGKGEPDPDWDGLRTHPRYLELKARYGAGKK